MRVRVPQEGEDERLRFHGVRAQVKRLSSTQMSNDVDRLTPRTREQLGFVLRDAARTRVGHQCLHSNCPGDARRWARVIASDLDLTGPRGLMDTIVNRRPNSP